ncbi:uncharacterized protein Dana_GF16530 [Drosophila ananassae]|uniref:LEM domain-containing protein n=1 Tax=Drosophila ananassae TaxID=7217 RepID=B3M2H1_DROAN|nr:LEM domain-containing protein Bocksbeutel [Drosophila ananassae]EDV43424.1 uncharacterized protein Dana_GF16530 [Drosophila ananassae]
MSDLAYLDTLNNKQLLAKCLELGLPGVPVTDSTRNVIIRRLRAAITGTPLNKSKTKKATPRRETVHGSHVAQPTSEPVRRTAGKSPSRAGGEKISAASRRTIAYGLDNTSISGRSVQTTTTVSDVGSQSEDDDYFMVDSPSVRYSHSTQTPSEQNRLRRSVSLTKSGVLTTSYTREVNQPNQVLEAEEDLPRSYTYERPTIQTSPLHTLPTYEPRIEPSTYRRSDLGFSRPVLTQSQLNSTSYLEESGYNQAPSPIHPRNTFSGSAKPFGGPGPDTAEPISRQRRPITEFSSARGRILQPTTTVNTLYPQLNQFYDQPDNAHSESESEVEEAPIRSTRLSPPQARPQVRRPLVRREEHGSPMSQFKELVNSVNRQYNLKFYFFLILGVMLATCFYVIMTPGDS